MDISINRVRHRWTEPAGFSLNRPEGASEYILLHFQTDVELSFLGQTHSVGKGAFIVYEPDTAHRFIAHVPLLHDWLHITGDMTSLMKRYHLHTDTLYQTDQSAGISEIVAFLESEFFAQRPYWEELAYAKMNEMLIRVSHCVHCKQMKPHVRDETAEHLREIRREILSAPWHSWNIPEMAKAVSLSESRLHAVYKAIFGISPKHDLILIRIEKAKTLLQAGSTVASVAEQLGYSNVYHFIRQFKQMTGTTPLQFARKG